MLSKLLRRFSKRVVGYCLTCRRDIYEHEVGSPHIAHVADGLYAHAACARGERG